jgi:hypothetical protein
MMRNLQQLFEPLNLRDQPLPPTFQRDRVDTHLIPRAGTF